MTRECKSGWTRKVQHFSCAAAIVTMAMGLSGCGLSSLTSGLGSSVFSSSSTPNPTNIDELTEAQLLSAAKANATDNNSNVLTTAALSTVSHGCPKVVVRASDNHMTIYEDGREGDSLAVRHRGEITKTARECIIEPGRVTIKYGFSGRVLLGPRGTSGNVTLPVNVAVANSNEAQVASQQVQVATDITLERPIGYFSTVNIVAFDVAEGTRPGDYTLVVGFPRANPAAVAPAG